MITDTTAATGLLHDFNHNAMINELHGRDEPIPTGEYLVTRDTFNHLSALAAGNPMADQRKESGWRLRVSRGGHPPAITCSIENYNTPELGQWHVLRFVGGAMEKQL